MHAVILSGGVGSRLWPVSRDMHPKPFMKLADRQSFLQKAYLRSAAIPAVQSITTVTNKELFFKTKQEYDQVKEIADHAVDINFITEPFGRNTAAAIALAALKISEVYGPESVLLVLPSDHVIANQPAFGQAVAEAAQLAKQGKVVTFGIKPSSPETGYGYIEANGNEVIRFVEKPSLEQAEVYLAEGKYLWNSGMFCFSAKSMLEEMEKLCPDILAATKTCYEQSKVSDTAQYRHLEINPETFQNVRSDSIDYAVMEKTTCAAIIPCDMGWSDIGTWTAISEFSDLDADGNSINGEAILHDVKNCYIESRDRVIGVVGVEDLVIVDTPDALLVANKKNSQEVKNIYAKLKHDDHEAHKLHKTVHRPWGTYTVLEEGAGFKMKRIEVLPGQLLSLQMHHHRAEHWVVVSGTALVVNGDDELTLQVSQSTYIPAGNKHRLSNMGKELLVLIEVQTGPYLGEDDIVRFDDIYGRSADAA